MSEKQRFTSNVIAKDSAKVNGGEGGGGGTSSYSDLTNKPSINGVTLSGNKSAHDLGIDVPTKTSDLQNDSGFLSAVPVASADTVGGVIVGSGLSIDEDGILSANGGSGGSGSTPIVTKSSFGSATIIPATNIKADVSNGSTDRIFVYISNALTALKSLKHFGALRIRLRGMCDEFLGPLFYYKPASSWTGESLYPRVYLSNEPDSAVSDLIKVAELDGYCDAYDSEEDEVVVRCFTHQLITFLEEFGYTGLIIELRLDTPMALDTVTSATVAPSPIYYTLVEEEVNTPS